MKNGIVAGAIAGVIGGILAILFGGIGSMLGARAWEQIIKKFSAVQKLNSQVKFFY